MLSRVIGTVERSKHRYFVWIPTSVAAEHRLVVIPRNDDVTFGILSSRLHLVWAITCGSTLEDRPGYNTKVCFLPYPFPTGLTPADTAHQRTETLPCGAIIPAGLTHDHEGGGAAGGSAQVKEEPATRAGDTEQNRLPPRHPAHDKPTGAPNNAATGATLLSKATAIAQAAKKLNDLRENWLNPPEWTHKVKEVTPLGMDHSPYPARIEPKPGLGEHDLKALQKRTLTNLYNAPPAWLTMAHQQLDSAVAAAYSWADYTPAMLEAEILKRLLALNLTRAVAA